MGHFRGSMHASRCGWRTGLPEAGRGTGPAPHPTHDEIARLAYSYWEARGGSGGSALEDWLRAERELIARIDATQTAP